MGEPSTPLTVALLAGAAAGFSVDVSLFPVDTIKTRLQSANGLMASGGFRGIYSGLGSVVVGSMPGAAIFFATYETTKSLLGAHASESQQVYCHMIAACAGEVAGCLVRVPTEVVKQRAQTMPGVATYSVFTQTLKSEGIHGFYRGYFSTVIREVPFSFLQFPLWEYCKRKWQEHSGKDVLPWQSAVCGAFSGAVASGITTPLDVAKTRIMLADSDSALARGNILYAMRVIYSEKGVTGLFAGIIPRVIWISIGGAIFLGVFDKVKLTLTRSNFFQ